MNKELRKQAEEEFDRFARLNGLLASRGLSNVVRVTPKGEGHGD